MRIKIRDITSVLLIVFSIIQIGYFKLLGEQISLFADASSNPLAVFYFLFTLVIMFTYLIRKKEKNKYIQFEVIIVLIAILLGVIRSLISGEIELFEGIKNANSYLYIVLALPIYDLLKRKWNLRELLKFLLFFTMGMFIIKAYISYYYGLTGTILWPAIGQENAVSSYVWTRNDVMRVNPACFGSLAIPISYYLMQTTKKLKNRILYLACIVGVIVYTLQIHQARSVLIYELLTIVLLIMMPKINSKAGLFRLALLVVGVIAFINSSYFSNLIGSFAPGTQTGESALSRFSSFFYFGGKFLNNPLFGTGTLTVNNMYAIGISGHISDIGFLTSVFQYGLLIIVFLVNLFKRGYTLSVRLRKENSPLFLLIFGMTASVMLTGINIDCFSSLYAFSLPFYIAICEYVWILSK